MIAQQNIRPPTTGECLASPSRRAAIRAAAGGLGAIAGTLGAEGALAASTATESVSLALAAMLDSLPIVERDLREAIAQHDAAFDAHGEMFDEAPLPLDGVYLPGAKMPDDASVSALRYEIAKWSLRKLDAAKQIRAVAPSQAEAAIAVIQAEARRAEASIEPLEEIEAQRRRESGLDDADRRLGRAKRKVDELRLSVVGFAPRTLADVRAQARFVVDVSERSGDCAWMFFSLIKNLVGADEVKAIESRAKAIRAASAESADV